MIPYGRQDISEIDIQAVIDVLRSEYLTQGPVVPEFEKSVAKYCDTKYAIAVNSATSALHIACLALGVGENDIVWTSPISFVASANCARYCGANIDFVDIDPRSNNMSIEALSIKLEIAQKKGNLPKVVIPVHLAGQSCEMDKIYHLSCKYGFKIIEDASHAIGGRYQNKAIGNCSFSDITIFSFHPVKIITTGEGGMCTTNDHEIALKLTQLRSHGIVRHASEMTNQPDGPWYYQQLSLGFNYRMTDIQAALGLSQLSRLDEFVAKRHEIANRYDLLLTESWIIKPWQHPDTYSALHLYIVRVKKNNGITTHLELFEKLRSSGILVNLHYIPIYRHPYYQKMDYNFNDFPEAESYYSEAISIPMYTTLTLEKQDFVLERLNKPFGYQNIF